MTHERARDDEPPGGPAFDEGLPDAVEIPVTEGPGPADEDVRADVWSIAAAEARQRADTRSPGRRAARDRS